MVKSVLFDLDDTLLDRNRSIEQFATAQYDKLADHFSHVSKAEYVTRLVELDSHGDVQKDLVYQSLIAEFAIKSITWQLLLQDYEAQFQFHCIPFNFLTETLHKLKQQGYLLGMVTNGLEHRQNRSIESLGIRDYFDAILISEVEQIRKPHPEIFRRATQQLGAAVQDSFFVGDNPAIDIIGAKNAGLKTVWKRNPYWPGGTAADAIISELNELPGRLELLQHSWSLAHC